MGAISTFGRRLQLPELQSLPLLATAVLSAAAAVAILASTLYLAIAYFHPLFYWDQWATVIDYHRFLKGEFGLGDLFAQHNEHRIAFPRLIFLADFVLGRGFNVINIGAIFVVQALHAALFGVIAWRLTRGPLFAIVLSIVTILLFSFAQAENMTWGFQVQFVGVYAAVTLALWLLALAIERQKAGASFVGYALGAAAMLIVATYTMSNGVTGGIAMIFVALALRARPALAVGVVALTAALLAAYFYSFHPVPSHSPPGFALHHPVDFVVYALVYLGGVLGAFGHYAAALMGLGGVAVAGFATARLLLGKDKEPARATLTGIMIFIALTAVATAFGRAFFGLNQALSSRYFTPAAVFWSAEIIYLASFAGAAPARLAAKIAFGAIGAAVAVGAINAHFAERFFARQHYLNLALASDAFLSGIEPNEAMQFAYPDPDIPRREAAFIKEQGLSIFAWPEGQMRGEPISAVFPREDDGACRGAFDSAETIAESDGVTASGWAWDRRRKSLVRRVLFVDSHDAIVGFASGGGRRRDVRAAVPEVRSRDVGWRGFANVPGGEPLRAYAVVGGGEAVCLFGARTTPLVETVGARPDQAKLSALGEPIDGKVVFSGGWTPNGYHVSAGAPPFDGPAFGSWSGADANQGEVTIGPFTAPDMVFALPFVSGPATGGQSIVVKDAETGEVYVRFKPAVRTEWSALVLTLPPDKATRPLLLVAADHGSEWGQWMAIGLPRSVVR